MSLRTRSTAADPALTPPITDPAATDPVRSALLTTALAAAATWVVGRLLDAAPPGGRVRWTRTNHRGEPITLLEGPAAVAGTALAVALAPGLPRRVRVAGVLAVTGAGAFGALDDLGETGTSKGLAGHLGELRRGHLTTGGLKIVGIGVTGLAAAAQALPPGRRAVDVAASGALVAGAANLLNLLDLRPGRALKVTLLAAPAAFGPLAGPLVAASAGAAAGALPADLAERTMLGDTGANALGALLGVAAVTGMSRTARGGVLAALVGLTLASERVSFTRVIESTPGLREFDALGRRPR